MPKMSDLCIILGFFIIVLFYYPVVIIGTFGLIALILLFQKVKTYLPGYKLKSFVIERKLVKLTQDDHGLYSLEFQGESVPVCLPEVSTELEHNFRDCVTPRLYVDVCQYLDGNVKCPYALYPQWIDTAKRPRCISYADFVVSVATLKGIVVDTHGDEFIITTQLNGRRCVIKASPKVKYVSSEYIVPGTIVKCKLLYYFVKRELIEVCVHYIWPVGKRVVHPSETYHFEPDFLRNAEKEIFQKIKSKGKQELRRKLYFDTCLSGGVISGSVPNFIKTEVPDDSDPNMSTPANFQSLIVERRMSVIQESKMPEIQESKFWRRLAVVELGETYYVNPESIVGWNHESESGLVCYDLCQFLVCGSVERYCSNFVAAEVDKGFVRNVLNNKRDLELIIIKVRSRGLVYLDKGQLRIDVQVDTYDKYAAEFGFQSILLEEIEREVQFSAIVYVLRQKIVEIKLLQAWVNEEGPEDLEDVFTREFQETAEARFFQSVSPSSIVPIDGADGSLPNSSLLTYLTEASTDPKMGLESDEEVEQDISVACHVVGPPDGTKAGQSSFEQGFGDKSGHVVGPPDGKAKAGQSSSEQGFGDTPFVISALQKEQSFSFLPSDVCQSLSRIDPTSVDVEQLEVDNRKPKDLSESRTNSNETPCASLLANHDTGLKHALIVERPIAKLGDLELDHVNRYLREVFTYVDKNDLSLSTACVDPRPKCDSKAESSFQKNLQKVKRKIKKGKGKKVTEQSQSCSASNDQLPVVTKVSADLQPIGQKPFSPMNGEYTVSISRPTLSLSLAEEKPVIGASKDGTTSQMCGQLSKVSCKQQSSAQMGQIVGFPMNGVVLVFDQKRLVVTAKRVQLYGIQVQQGLPLANIFRKGDILYCNGSQHNLTANYDDSSGSVGAVNSFSKASALITRFCMDRKVSPKFQDKMISAARKKYATVSSSKRVKPTPTPTIVPNDPEPHSGNLGRYPEILSTKFTEYLNLKLGEFTIENGCDSEKDLLVKSVLGKIESEIPKVLEKSFKASLLEFGLVTESVSTDVTKNFLCGFECLK